MISLVCDNSVESTYAKLTQFAFMIKPRRIARVQSYSTAGDAGQPRAPATQPTSAVRATSPASVQNVSVSPHISTPKRQLTLLTMRRRQRHL